jgi:hypothetical protein
VSIHLWRCDTNKDGEYARDEFMNALDVLFKTNRFNLSKIGDHFINPCCFGEDLAAWLRLKLGERGLQSRDPYQEDWGWELPVVARSGSYYLCMSGNPDETGADADQGEWRIIVEKKRSIRQRLTGQGKIGADDELARIVKEILSAEPEIREVHLENLQ